MKFRVSMENQSQVLKLSFQPERSPGHLVEAVRLAMTHHANPKTVFFEGLDLSDLVSGAEGRRMSISVYDETFDVDILGENAYWEDVILFSKIIEETTAVINGRY